MKPSQCEACRAVGPTVMCNLCPTGPRRSVQPPATPQEPDPQKNLAVLTLKAQQAERAYDRLNLCSDHRDKATGRCIVCDGEERLRRASAPPAVWQDIETAPKDGRYVWLYSPHFRKYFTAAGNILPGRWDATVGRWSVPHWGHIDVAPTHFQPLHSPPTPGGK